MKELQEKGSSMLNTVGNICEANGITWFMAYGSLLGAIRHHGPIPWDYDIDIYVPEKELERFVQVLKKELPTQYWVDYRDNNKFKRSFPRIGLSGYETEILHVDVYRLCGLPANNIIFKLFAFWSRVLFVLWKSRVIDIDNYYPDAKRKRVSKMVKALTSWIPLDWLLIQLDKQANKIPLEAATYASCPFETQSCAKRVDKTVFDQSILVDYDGFKVRVPKDYERYLQIEYGDWRQLPPKAERDRQLNKMYEVKALK